MRKILLVAAAVVLVLATGLFLWARSVFSGDGVRDAVASQLSSALGQPVKIATVGASIFPRVTLTLYDVRIGEPAHTVVGRLHVGTAFGALLSRRIENADVRLDSARIELPLRIFGAQTSNAPGSAAGAPVEIVSVDAIGLRDVQIVSGGRTLGGDADLQWQPGRLIVRDVALAAGDAQIKAEGELSDLTGPKGRLELEANNISLVELASFFSDFSGGAAAPAARASAPATSASTMDLSVALEANRASFGTLVISDVKGTARVTAQGIAIDPMHFGVFGGAYDGALQLTPGATLTVHMKAALQGIDVAEAMAFAGSPGSITGRGAGRIDLVAQGGTADAVARSARGTVRLDLTDGTVKGLGLVKTVVLVGSGRADSQARARTEQGSEAFSRLGMTAAVASGVATSSDLRFESPDVLLAAAGQARLTDATVRFAGDVQLSETLSKQAGQDLYRYTQKDGRVTLPAVVTGPISNLQVAIDMAAATKRALGNKANEELKKALGRIIK